MGNFFENLAVRSLQPVAPETTRLLQPRLPSLFESPGGTEDSISAPHTDKSVEAKAEAHESEVERDTSHISEKDKRSPILVEPQRTILEHVDTESTISTRPSLETPRRPEREEKQSIAQVGKNPVHEIKTHINFLTDEHESKKVAESRSSLEHNILPQVEVAKPKSESKPILMPLPISATTRVQDSILEPTAVREPVVHIHIGRIDVRAVTTSQYSAPRVMPQKPRLTLDDYLRQRDEGKR